MRKAFIFAALACLLVFSSTASFAQTGSSKSTTSLNSEVNTLWPDQTAGSITPFDARQTLLDIISSYPNLLSGATVTGQVTFTSVLGTVTTQSGTTYTFASTDCGTEVTFTNSGAVTATIPATLPVGCNISVLQAGASKVSVNGSAVAAATLHSAHSYTGTSAQWAIIGVNIEANSGGSSAIAILTGDGS